MLERKRPFVGEVSRGHLMAMFCGGNFENSAANSVRVTELLALSVPLSLPLWAAIYSFGNLD
jgi:hypothetical protein